MVRTPLARRVESDVTLNAVHCILPKFDDKAVDSIAVQFEKGDDGIAGGAEVITEEVTLARNPAFAQPVSVAESVTELLMSDQSKEDLASWLIQDEAEAQPSETAKTKSPTTVKPATREQDGPDLLTVTPYEPDEVDASAPADVFAVLESLPSYTIPSRTPGSAISRAFRLAALLAYKYGEKALEPAARKLVLNALLGEMDTFRADLEAKGELEARLERVAKTSLYERSVTYGGPTLFPAMGSSQLTLDDRGVRILLGRARRALPEGLVDEYIARNAPDDDDVSRMMILAIALGQDPALPDRIEARAADLVSSWLKSYHSAITRLPEVAREDFDKVRRQSGRPEITNFRIPPREHGDRQGRPWDRHVLSDDEGKYRCILKDMEAHVLNTELEHGALAWYRNPPNRAKNALVIPWQKWDGWHGLYVDFLFVHEVGGRLRPSIIDPHGAFMNDAVPKLRGLAAYVEEHADVYHRVQVIDLISGQYRMLDLLDPAVREAVLAYKGNDSDDAAELYALHGTTY
ncbi:hypothetical protein NtRootA2_41450 (plasmid) [Arthrobacter sp. NtRootA2]|nr:hypothetical protein NtRootA2_41450 [Arthrobacter sp. NtRootA2]